MKPLTPDQCFFQLIRNQRLTEEAIASMLKVSQSTVSRMIHGHYKRLDYRLVDRLRELTHSPNTN